MQNYSSGVPSRPLCTLSIGSMTLAIKARRLLSAKGIVVKVKKVEDNGSRRGCVYGIEYPCEISGNLRVILKDSGIVI